MSDLRDLYQEVILDHTKHPRNKGSLPQANRKADGVNPLCGDKVTLYLNVEGDKIKELKFEGSGCAISTASTSMLTEQLKGKTVSDAQKLFGEFHNLLTTSQVPADDLGKLMVFEGVREFPMRVKCATLAWHTLMAALKNEQVPVTTEE